MNCLQFCFNFAFNRNLRRQIEGEENGTISNALKISRISSIFLLIGYFGFLVFQLKTHRHLFAEEEAEEGDDGGERGQMVEGSGGGGLGGAGAEAGAGAGARGGAGGGAEGGGGGGSGDGGAGARDGGDNEFTRAWAAQPGGGGMVRAHASFVNMASEANKHMELAKGAANDYSNQVFGFSVGAYTRPLLTSS